MHLTKLLSSLLVCLGVGWIGSYFTTPEIGTWYAALQKPAYAPPNWVFAPVWTALYILMGISLYLLWRQRGTGRAPFIWFGIQLLLNLSWSFVFFRLHSPAGGLAVIIALWLAIALTIRAFRRYSRIAAWLLAPYLLWVSFALLLNFGYWRLNG